ncbi:MAG: GAF domain-containing protein [Candidatus Omnitrophica bacterium]|nr:GAF domain-containing protein [Candidatus Omnitrophota bacterium]
MEHDNSKELSRNVIQKSKWMDFLKRFVDVLRINIFIVDCEGHVLIPPHQDGSRRRYGSIFLARSFMFDLSGRGGNLLDEFESHGKYLEAKDPFDFRAFAIPVKADGDRIIAYMIVGPVILNKRWENNDYINLFNLLGLKIDDFMDAVHEIRVVSYVTVKAILDLLSEVAKDVVALSLERKKLHHSRFNKKVLKKEIADIAQDLYTTIHLDELLVTILDVALNLSQAECGSIMFLDEVRGELEIKVSRGMDEERAQNTRLRIGEGIAGIAAQENRSFVICGEEGDDHIKHLLKRPDIHQAMVVPLSSKNRVFGVLNLHTLKEDGQIEANANNLRHLSKLISAAIHSI